MERGLWKVCLLATTANSLDLYSPPNLEVYQTQPESSSMLDGDQDQAKPISKILQDFIDGNRNVHDVIEEVIEETDDPTMEDFLTW